ncbi:MAG: NRDE family protein [Myxococcales bacterium]|nr:NRDE family protein [Myxococcales bacterium]
MCLLVVLHRVHVTAPLVVAANRDEFIGRPATPMGLLQEAPRIYGGRDETAGGSWLTFNQHGVFAGITNRPGAPRAPGLHSRGEWPIALAKHPTASIAAEAFVSAFKPREFSPGWLLVGDSTELFHIDMTGDTATVRALEPGVHALENVPLDVASPKSVAARAAAEAVLAQPWDEARDGLAALLRSHEVPAGAVGFERVDGMSIPLETHARCVYAGPYGTRASAIARLEAGHIGAIWWTDGPPCTHPFTLLEGVGDGRG